MEIMSHWQSFDFKIAGSIFIAYLLIDGMYAYYTITVTKKKPVVSASIGAFMHFLIAFGVLNYVQLFIRNTTRYWFLARNLFSGAI